MYNVVTYYPRRHAPQVPVLRAQPTARARSLTRWIAPPSVVGRKHTWRAHGNFWNGKDRRRFVPVYLTEYGGILK